MDSIQSSTNQSASHLNGSSINEKSIVSPSISTEGGASSGERPTETPQKKPQTQSTQRQRRPQKCRFFASKKGCKSGDACPFLHVRDEAEPAQSHAAATPPSQQVPPSNVPAVASASNDASAPADESPDAATINVQQPRPLVSVSADRVVQRPKPSGEAQDPRKFQISQIKTRFSAVESDAPDGTTTLTFSMAPSDPDFPFDIEALQCSVRLPAQFPRAKTALPKLRVTNKEMERGFQINVEQGFDRLWASMESPTLLNAFKMLDRQLEEVLTAPKADTIKLVANAGPVSKKPQVKKTEQFITVPAVTPPSTSTAISNRPIIGTQKPNPIPRPVITQKHREAAKARRTTETEILTHRLGRNPGFTAESKNTMFTIPIEPRKRTALPVALQSIKSIRLFVPDEYGIEPCSIELLGVEGDAVTHVEKAFEKMVETNMQASLLAHVNYLASNIHTMAVPIPTAKEDKLPPANTQQPLPPAQTQTLDMAQPQQAKDAASAQPTIALDDHQSHIIHIPRPPEWTTNTTVKKESTHPQDENDTASTFTDSELDTVSEGDDEEETTADPTDTTSSQPREAGVLISFPHMELHGIELLELTMPSITVKCERCKDTMDIARIKNNERGDYTGIRTESCKKCAMIFSIGYRKELMHANSTRAGYLDLTNCTITDLLPSPFTPTCSTCSTSFPSPGITAVRGSSILEICRECHTRLRFLLPELKFLIVGTAAAAAATRGLPLKRKPRENLGIVAGTELPKKGRCGHYSKSYRWFRFSCCNKVYPCDRCHDEGEDHGNEFANRMICGYCSREQNYRPEDCGMCRAPLTGKTGSGFWEGGKGTRDRARMSKKDPRKYKRRGGSVVGSGGKK